MRLTVVHLEITLKIAGHAVAAHVIADAASAGSDGFTQSFADEVSQRIATCAREPARGDAWTDTGAEQRFAGVDVAYTHDNMAVHDDKFDCGAALACAAKERCTVEIGRQRFGAE